MRFIDEKGAILGLMDASARGYPVSGTVFSPTGDADLRPAVYAPDATYSDTVSSVIAALFPEDIDPFMAERLTSRAFPLDQPRSEQSDGIIVVDYSSGPSASAADSEAAFLAGILAFVARRSGAHILLADGSGSEGPALSEAVAGLKDMHLVLLYPEGQEARGVKGPRLAREGGQVKLLSVRGDSVAVDRLIREAAGSSIAGRFATAAGPANPARFAARIVSLASTFAVLRNGVSGDLFMGIRAGDGFGLASCLWAWRLGLPITGIVLAAGEKGVLGMDLSGRSLVERFDTERPGVLRSLTLLQHIDRESALQARAEFLSAGGPDLDLASAMSLAAAKRALEAGLSGHARIVVPCGGAPGWDEFEGPSGRGSPQSGPGSGLRDARVDAEINPSLDELERALTA
jgi:threonine synthase